MQQTSVHRLGLVALLVLLGAQAQTAHAQSKIRKRLQRYRWVGDGPSLGKSPLALELRFTRRATRASLSVYWSRYQKWTVRRAPLRVGPLAKGKGLRIRDRFADTHPLYKYRSSTGIYCHIPSRSFLRTNQFRCKLQYSGWILMHRKGVAARPMTRNPPARPPSLKGRPPRKGRPTAGPSTKHRSPGRRKPYLVGCWMKTIVATGAHRKNRSLLFTSKGTFRWIHARRNKTSRGTYRVNGKHLLLLNARSTRGTRWRFSVTRCMRRRPFQPCLQLYKPQSIRRTRRGKILPRGRVGTQTHLFMRVGTHPRCR